LGIYNLWQPINDEPTGLYHIVPNLFLSFHLAPQKNLSKFLKGN
jgi:hypothetical protein